MRVVFMGTPSFAVETLERLARSGRTIPLVVTQPDRPLGRGQKLSAPPVKQRAAELGLPLFQPERIKSREAVERLRRAAPDVIVVVGYGQIISQAILELPRHGCVNVHASLLPFYRGAAPINWAIVNAEPCSGVTTIRLVKKLDAGDILLARDTPIGPEETAPELAARLAPLGAELLLETLDGLEAGTIEPRSQEESQASYAPILKREDGRIDWRLPAREIANRIRGFDPWPGAFTRFRGKRLHIRRGAVVEAVIEAAAEEAGPRPGEIALRGDRLLIGCGDGSTLEAGQVQLEGKQRMPGAEFARGRRLTSSEMLG